MTLRAIREESTLQIGIGANVTQQWCVVRSQGAGAVSAVATQAQEGRRLAQQVVGDRSVWLVTNGAVFRHGGVLVGKRTLLIGVTTITDHVDRRLLEIPLCLSVTVVAVRADHLSFLDGMVLRHRCPGVDIAVTLVAHRGLVNGHRHPRRPADIGVLYVDDLLDVEVGMRVVAVGTCHAVLGMDGRVPGHGRRAGVVALEAQIGPRFLTNFAVGVVASRTVESHSTANLMRMGDIFLLGHAGVAAVT